MEGNKRRKGEIDNCGIDTPENYLIYEKRFFLSLGSIVIAKLLLVVGGEALKVNPI